MRCCDGVDKAGLSASQCARIFGVSRPTFYHAARAFRENGLAGLVPRRPGPRGAHKINDTVLKALAEARRDRPAITTTELVALVNRHFGVTVHRRTIERAFSRVKCKL